MEPLPVPPVATKVMALGKVADCGESKSAAWVARKYVKRVGPVAVPTGEVTTIFLAPILDPAGVKPMIVVGLVTENEVIAIPLIVALVEPVKLVPVIVMEVPPRIVPEAGETEVTCNHCA